MSQLQLLARLTETLLRRGVALPEIDRYVKHWVGTDEGDSIGCPKCFFAGHVGHLNTSNPVNLIEPITCETCGSIFNLRRCYEDEPATPFNQRAT